MAECSSGLSQVQTPAALAVPSSMVTGEGCAGGSAGRPSSPEQFADMARAWVELPGVLPTVRGVVSSAVQAMPCDWAAVAVTDVLTDRPARLAASNDPDLMATIGQIAVEVGASPGISAFEQAQVVMCADLTAEVLFQAYAETMVTRTPVRSVLSLPLTLHGATTGVMSLYAAAAHAFDDVAVTRARVLAEHAAIAIEAARSEDQVENLELALLRSRTIGAAMGILIERHKLTADDAFARLRAASQNTNRKLSELAAELVETGILEGP